MKERIVYLDVVKCLAILLVCIGHSYWASPRGMTCPLVQWIYTFHMPLFMLMCGFFSKGLFELTLKNFVYKEYKRLILPILMFTGLKIALLTLVGANVWKSELIGGMWFLRCLLFCDILVYFGKKYCKFDWLVCVVTCTILFIVPGGTFLRTNFFILIYWTGFFWRKYYTLYKKGKLWITLIAALLSVTIGSVGEPKVVYWNDLLSALKYYFAGIGWSFAIIGTIYYLCRCFDVERLAKIGTCTLLIYGANSLFGNGIIRELITWRCVLNWDWVCVLIIGVIECTFCYGIVLFYRFVLRKCGYISSY